MSPDISMCANEVCAKKLDCYRFIATPNPHRQTYAGFDADDCESYIECKSKGQMRRLNIQCEGEE